MRRWPAHASLFVLAAIPMMVQAQTAGTVQGRVLNATTQGNLEGVQVRVVGSRTQTVTDSAGRYVLSGVGPGPVTLEFNYLGYQPVTQQVTVVAGQSVNLDATLGSEVTVLDDLRVTTLQQSQSAALNAYRNSDSITNIVASDDIGQFVDQNVAESLQRLPGVSISRDQGEGRFVTIRGFASEFSNVQINGMRIGTPEAGRSVALDVIPNGSVERLEVTKVQTPDMPGDAIGGLVEITSASAFDREGRTIRYRAEASYNELEDRTSPKFELGFSDVFDAFGGNDTLGVSIGANFLDRRLGSDNIEVDYDFLEDAVTAEDVFVPVNINLRKYDITRERIGANLNLDYRPEFGQQYYLKVLYSEFNDAETRQRTVFALDDGDLTANGNDLEYALPADAFRRSIRFRTKNQDTLALAVGGKNIFDLWTVDYQVGHSLTKERVLDEVEGRFEFTGNDLTARLNTSTPIPSLAIFDGMTPDTAYLRNENYEFERIVLAPILVDDTDTNASLNFERRLSLGMNPLTVKFGLDTRIKDKDVNAGESELRVGPDLNLGQFTRSPRGYGLGLLGDGISSSAFVDFYNANADQFSERPRDVAENVILNAVDDFVADETVNAAYVMGTMDFDRLRLIAGVRVEQTDFEATGNVLTFDANGDFQPVTQRSVSRDYTSVLPGLHARYELSDNMVLRGAVTTSIARPDFDDISPRQEVNLEDMEIETGNPDLDPYEAVNFDILFDWYLPSASVLSVGLFRKDIDNFIADFTSTNDAAFPGFEVTKPVNSTRAEVTGFEFNVQQSLDAFNFPLKGVLVGANLTLLDGEFESLERPGETLPLPQAAEQIMNLYVGYEQGRFSGRLSLTQRDEFLDDIGGDRLFDIYVAEHTHVDFIASYRFSKAIEAVVEVANITDEPLELFQGDASNTLQFEEYGRTVSVGLRGRF